MTYTVSMQLVSRYSGDKNAIEDITVERKQAGEWKLLDLELTSPGFDLFVYAVLHCQHTYFRINCAERGLLLDHAQGSIEVSTDRHWNLQDVRVEFSGQLVRGQAGRDDIDYIVSRMLQCPVSRNISVAGDKKTQVNLAEPQVSQSLSRGQGA